MTDSLHHCRLCAAEDRAALIDELAEEMWLKHRGASPRDEPFAAAGPYWHAVFRGLAEDAVDLLQLPRDGA